MERFLIWLEKYKIVFEVSSFSLISILGIVISINTCNISKADLKIKKSENRPSIVVESKLEDQDSSGFQTQTIKILNNGGRLRNIIVDKQMLCRVQMNCSRCPGPERSYFDVPLKDYLIGDSTTKRETGEIIGFFKKNNYRDFNNVYDSCRVRWSPFNYSYSPEILILIKIKGVTLDENEEVFYFKISNESFAYNNTIEAESSDEKEWLFHKACTSYAEHKYYTGGLNYQSINTIHEKNKDSIFYKSIRKNLLAD